MVFLGLHVISLPSVLSLRAEHTGRLGAAWSQASPALKACLPLTFLSSTNSFSTAVRLLISSSYLSQRRTQARLSPALPFETFNPLGFKPPWVPRHLRTPLRTSSVMQPTREETWGTVVKYSCPPALRERAQTLRRKTSEGSRLFGPEPLGAFIGTGKDGWTVVYLCVHSRQAGRH